MKVVINRCYGGFGLSDKAFERLIELGMSCSDEDADQETDITKWNEPILGHSYYLNETYKNRNSVRSDPRIVQVVEELGEDANGPHAKLKIVEIPDGIKWYVEDYDGQEWIAQEHQTWS